MIGRPVFRLLRHNAALAFRCHRAPYWRQHQSQPRDAVEDASTKFRKTAQRLYPAKVAASLCVTEQLVRMHEIQTGRPVADFGGYLVATHRAALPVSFDRESRTWFDMWQRVRREVGRLA